MKINVKIRDEKLQHDINREATKISALSSRKIDKYEYLTGEEVLPSNQRQILKQANFPYSPWGKAFEKQIEKQFDAIKSLVPSNKLKQIEGVFPKHLMNDLIRAKLKEVVELWDNIKKDDLNYQSNYKKTYNLGKYSLRIAFFRDAHEGYISLRNADLKRGNFTIELKSFEEATKAIEKKSFLNNLGLLFSAREKALNSFENKLFPIKNLGKISTRQPVAEPTPEVKTELIPKQPTETTPTKHKKSKLKLQQEFMNKIIAAEKDVNNTPFINHFNYQNVLSLEKDLINAKQDENEEIVSNINHVLIGLLNDNSRKEVPENGNPKKVVDIIHKILNLNKQKKEKELTY